MLVRRWPDTPDERARLFSPRDDLLLESADPAEPARPAPSGRFRQQDGPFTSYERVVTTDSTAGQLVETTSYSFSIPWFGWLFGLPVKRVLAHLAEDDETLGPIDLGRGGC